MVRTFLGHRQQVKARVLIFMPNNHIRGLLSVAVLCGYVLGHWFFFFFRLGSGLIQLFWSLTISCHSHIPVTNIPEFIPLSSALHVIGRLQFYFVLFFISISNAISKIHWQQSAEICNASPFFSFFFSFFFFHIHNFQYITLQLPAYLKQELFSN